MARSASTIIAALVAVAIADTFDPTQHLGGNSPWFAGPNVFGISPDAPEGCSVDQAAFLSRHGSRYPDPSAYNGWVTLAEKIHNASFTTDAEELQFLKTWQPVLTNPEAQLSELSLGGYKELYDMGVDYRWLYPSSFYQENTPFVLWANRYQDTVFRVVDSARLFARGYLGPNATEVGKVYVLNQTDPRSVANSLAPSDLCPAYKDNGSGETGEEWTNIYTPPIVDRINALVPGLEFDADDIANFAYLCGFETQITGKRSPWCSTLTEIEFEQYEYAQDLRYWYGSGPGSPVGNYTMLPFLQAVIERFVDGPNATYHSSNYSASFMPNPLIATFSNDGQVNQLAAGTGVFDDEAPLPGNVIPEDRIFRASRFTPMRGTIGFERLNCGSQGRFMRVKFNGAVYPVARCQDGPGRSCALKEYQELIAQKAAIFGGFEQGCGIANTSIVPPSKAKTTFLKNLGLPFEYVVRP